MAFIVPRHPLTPAHQLALDVDPAQRIVRAADLAAYRDAEAAVVAACEQARAIVAGAQEAFDAERRRGHLEGTEHAQREGAQHMAEQIARTDGYFTRVEDQLAALVMQGIRRIVEGYSDHERVLQSVRSALATMRNQKQITLRLHPDNVAHVQARTAELLAAYPGIGLLDVVADARMAADGCVLESDIGVVEASTEGQLAALEAAFRKVRGTPGVAPSPTLLNT